MTRIRNKVFFSKPSWSNLHYCSNDKFSSTCERAKHCNNFGVSESFCFFQFEIDPTTNFNNNYFKVKIFFSDINLISPGGLNTIKTFLKQSYLQTKCMNFLFLFFSCGYSTWISSKWTRQVKIWFFLFKINYITVENLSLNLYNNLKQFYKK